MKKIKRTILKYVFQCHEKESRCFHIKGEPMSICARCTGLMVGYPTAVVLFLLYGTTPWLLILIIPMAIDGTYQLVNEEYESNNIKRVISGFLGSFAIIYIIFVICLSLNEVAYNILEFLNIPYRRL